MHTDIDKFKALLSKKVGPGHHVPVWALTLIFAGIVVYGIRRHRRIAQDQANANQHGPPVDPANGSPTNGSFDPYNAQAAGSVPATYPVGGPPSFGAPPQDAYFAKPTAQLPAPVGAAATPVTIQVGLGGMDGGASPAQTAGEPTPQGVSAVHAQGPGKSGKRQPHRAAARHALGSGPPARPRRPGVQHRPKAPVQRAFHHAAPAPAARHFVAHRAPARKKRR